MIDWAIKRTKQVRFLWRKVRLRVLTSLLTLALFLALCWTLFPIWWAFALSIKRPPDFFTAKTLPFIQFNPTLTNWQDEWQAFGDPAGLGRGLLGSLIVATTTSALSLELGGLAAVGLRHRRRLPTALVGLLLLPRIFPPVVIALPFAGLMQRVNLTDTWLALVIAHTTLTLPLALLVLYSASLELPDELLEAAQLDGCGTLGLVRWIIAPLILPALLATGALCFAQSWNEYLFALMNVQQRAQTAPLSIAALLTKDGIEFTYVGSHLILVMVPPLLLALVARRYLVRGLSFGLLQDEVAGPAQPK